jgi:hypothetical protein
MNHHQTKKVLLVVCIFFSTLAFARSSNRPQSVQPFSLRLGQGLCVTMPKLQTTFLASSYLVPFEKYDWLLLHINGCLDFLEDNLGNRDYIVGAVPTAELCATGIPLSPFLELGVGINYVSNMYLSGRALGSNMLFSPTVSGGIHLNENFMGLTLAYTFRHLSNASLHDDNDGVNFQYITVSFGL